MKKFRIFKQNIEFIWKYWIKCIGFAASVLSVMFLFITWEDMGMDSLLLKAGITAVLCSVLLLWSVLWNCAFKRQKVIWQSSSGRIIVQYADLIKDGFKNKSTQERLYVIPVNSAFDTIVDTDISLCVKPLISPYSLHGKWIDRMAEIGINKEYIDREISSCLQKQKINPCKTLTAHEKERGKREIFDLGTIAVIKGAYKNIFLLLALTDFDKNNNAHVSVEEFENVIKALIEFYNQHGQGHELIVPLMGTNLSRAGLTHDDSLRIITSLFQLYGNKIHGNVRIVINKKDKDKATINI